MNANSSWKKYACHVALSIAVCTLAFLPHEVHAQGTLFIEGGRVGVGIQTPLNVLHVFGGSLRVERNDGITPNIRFRTNGPAVTQNWLFQVNANTGVFAIYDETAGHSPIRFFRNGVANTMVLKGGKVGILTEFPQGELDVNGTIYQRGAQLHADYVFEPEYELESIEDHAAAMWGQKHLPAVPGRTVDDTGREVIEIGSYRKGMMEELEKAHVYIAQLNDELQAKDEVIDKLEQRLSHLEELMASLQDSKR